jgi:tRNA 2-thiouridine synthesizing protein A
MFEVDCRGLSCPIPVVRLQKAIAAHPGEPIMIVVDNETAHDNVARIAQEKGYSVKTTRKGDDINLELVPRK